MLNLCEQLHNLVMNGKRYDFNAGYSNIPKNGIYILFENGEVAHNCDRIVRIGTHNGDGRLRNRIVEHFEKENKNRSIFRKNIGRCFLKQDNNPYLDIWNLDTTTKEKKDLFAHIIDREFEKKLEKRISEYIQTNFSFTLFEVPTKEERLYFEARLIGTVSKCEECKPSDKWLGLFSPIDKIRQSGLWQVMELYSNSLTEEEINILSGMLVKN